MYDLETVKSTCKTKLEEITDPYLPTSTTSVLGNVIRGEPDQIGLFNNPLGVLLFADGKEELVGLNKRGPINGPSSFKQREQAWKTTIDGAVILFINGNNDAADTEATHLSDIISDFFKNQYVLELPGTLVYPLTNGNSFNWRPISVSLENMDKPLQCLTLAYRFVITIQDNLKHNL
jgi:hypothetical protein